MTWSNEYKQSIRDQEISDEIFAAERRCTKAVDIVLLVIAVVVLSNTITARGVTERLEKIEHKVGIKND